MTTVELSFQENRANRMQREIMYATTNQKVAEAKITVSNVLKNWGEVYFSSYDEVYVRTQIVEFCNCITKNFEENAKRSYNLDRLHDISQSPQNWSDNDASVIGDDVVSECEKLVRSFSHQPTIYPTGRESVQMQYELEDKSYLEFEVFKDRITCLNVPKRVYSQATFETFSYQDINKINEVVEDFYAG